MTDDHATDEDTADDAAGDQAVAPAGLLSAMSRRGRLILGWGLLLAFVVLFAILALV